MDGPTTAIGHFKWLIGILAVIWIIWFFAGGTEHPGVNYPFIKPPPPLDTGEKYGPNGTISIVPTPADWQKIETQDFSIMAPAGWSWSRINGSGSYMGEFTDGQITLFFDYGKYSNTLIDTRDGNYIARNESIDGQSATLVRPRNAEGTTTGVYFGNLPGGNKLIISGNNLTPDQQTTAFIIFRSIRFE